jgi:hypothetical protein
MNLYLEFVLSQVSKSRPGPPIVQLHFRPLAFKFISGLRKPVEPAPDQPIHGHNHQRNNDRGQQQMGKRPLSVAAIDLRAQADRLQRAVLSGASTRPSPTRSMRRPEAVTIPVMR